MPSGNLSRKFPVNFLENFRREAQLLSCTCGFGFGFSFQGVSFQGIGDHGGDLGFGRFVIIGLGLGDKLGFGWFDGVCKLRFRDVGGDRCHR